MHKIKIEIHKDIKKDKVQLLPQQSLKISKSTNVVFLS